MFNDDMRMIAKSLYLQTRYYRAELLLEGITQTKILFFGLKYLDLKHWQVSDLDVDLCNKSDESIVACVYKTISMRLNKQGDHGFLMLIDKDKQFKGVLFGIEGMLAQYVSSHEDLLLDYKLFDLDDLENKDDSDSLFTTVKGDPISKPDQWDYYMKVSNDELH